MAESSGFFQAMMDEKTGDYDRKYLAREFANYFALFVKNGVFGSPTNQLRVAPGNDLSISVASGYAFIKGMWYHNDSSKNIVLVPNYTSSNRVDTVRVRMSDITRSITVDVFTGDTDLVRGEDVYDLQIATVTVKPSATSVTAADIQDTRPNQSVCGFVTQLLSVQTTEDLFAQYQSQFDQWFRKVQDTLDENTAGSLQNQIDDVVEKIKSIETSVGSIDVQSVKDEVVPRWIFSYGSSKPISSRQVLLKFPNGLTGLTSNYLYIEILWLTHGSKQGSTGELQSVGDGRVVPKFPWKANVGSFTTRGTLQYFDINDDAVYIRNWTVDTNTGAISFDYCYKYKLSTGEGVPYLDVSYYCLPTQIRIYAKEGASTPVAVTDYT